MLVSASFLNSTDKRETIKKLNNTDIDYLHIDYMDGNFVKNKTETFFSFKKILKENKKPLDIHLMAHPTNSLIEKFALLNTSYITIHSEIKDLDKYIELIKNYGIKVGLAIKPSTNIKKVFPYLNNIDLILIMSVKPGLAGQEFIESTYNKISILKEELENRNLTLIISVDGGINENNINELEVDMVVSGSFITNSNNYQTKINELR